MSFAAVATTSFTTPAPLFAAPFTEAASAVNASYAMVDCHLLARVITVFCLSSFI